ncbi:MAG: alanine racemase [bacterium]
MSIRPTIAEVDLRAISNNIKAIRRKVTPAQVMAVVKANAYGHGLKEVAKIAMANEVNYLGVALLEEGVQLRTLSKQFPVLVFGGFFESQIEAALRNNLELTLYDGHRARLLSQKAGQLAKTARVHIKIDTGMGRIGVPWSEAVDFIKEVIQLKNIEIVGVYTHFASADERDKSYARKQLQRFQSVLAKLQEAKIHVPLQHAANSGAILDLPESYFNLVRCGVSMYGYYPSRETSESLKLSPAMILKSQIISLKQINKNSYISYNRTYKTDGDTVIATVPIGYGDGYNRLLSNRGKVLISGQRYPVVGRVCMDQIMVDVGPKPQINVGDEVVLLGKQGKEEISMYEICDLLNTIPYEVTCWISERVPRIYRNLN